MGIFATHFLSAITPDIGHVKNHQGVQTLVAEQMYYPDTDDLMTIQDMIEVSVFVAHFLTPIVALHGCDRKGHMKRVAAGWLTDGCG